MPTNTPPVSTTEDINNLLEIKTTDHTFGSSVVGNFIDSRNLLIKIQDANSANLTAGTTIFDIKDSSELMSASGAVNRTQSQVTLGGSFADPIPPFITAFVADDPTPIKNGVMFDEFYSAEDTLTIRFSESTNTPGGFDVMGKFGVDKLFEFKKPAVMGSDYSGRWINPSTFIIEVLDTNGDPRKDPVLGITTVKAKESGGITNEKGTSANSFSISPPLDGSFTHIIRERDVMPGQNLETVLPSGVTILIQFPDGTPRTFLQEGEVGNFGIPLILKPFDVMTGNVTTCENGCTISFYFNQDDLPFGVSVGKLRILHVKDNEQTELLIPTITPTSTKGNFLAEVTITTLSTFGFGFISSGGGGGDETPPTFNSFESITCVPELGCGTHIAKEIKFVNDMPTAKLPVGHTSVFTLNMYENSGTSALQHVSMYFNIQGFGSYIQDSDTFVRYQKGQPIEVKDPHDMLSDAKITIIPRGNDITANFYLTFAKPIDTTDVIIRAWDQNRNFRDATFKDAFMVLSMNVPEDPTTSILKPETSLTSEPEVKSIPQEMISKWTGYATKGVTDAEILEYLEIKGTKIPTWYKNQVSGWVYDKTISQSEFVNALKFLSEAGLLS